MKAPTNGPPSTLVEGQHLDQPTFHALYEAMPPHVRAELIDGVVYMPCPARWEHGNAQLPVLVWLDYYAEYTPGVEAIAEITVILGGKSEPEPDALLRILAGEVGQSRIEGGYLRGAPELVVEVSKATRYVDLGPKLRDYERAGVLEYIVRAIDPDEIFWFGLEHGTFVQRSAGEDGFFRSTVFPGLWLDPVALLKGDRRRIRSVVDLGCATAEHTAFVARLAAECDPSELHLGRGAVSESAEPDPASKAKRAGRKRKRK